MFRPMIVLAVAALVVAGLVSAALHRHAVAAPCTSTCDISAHMAMMSGGSRLAMSSMPGMSGMPGMGQPTPSPAAATAPPMHPPQGAAADAMVQSMNDTRMTRDHMTMTMAMPATTADQQRAAEILATLRKAIAPYEDYRAAIAAGYQQFLPQLPQPIYHFTNYGNAFLNEFSFDPARPTSLMYKTVPGGFELIGAMYTAPARSTNEQLNARVPLSVATWHLHTNLCLPPPDKRMDMWGPHPQFGLAGSITSAQACQQAGGTFKPVIYNWMVHVWPFETDPSKIWATEEHPGAMNH